jgi:hypothetical protein
MMDQRDQDKLEKSLKPAKKVLTGAEFDCRNCQHSHVLVRGKKMKCKEFNSIMDWEIATDPHMLCDVFVQLAKPPKTPPQKPVKKPEGVDCRNCQYLGQVVEGVSLYCNAFHQNMGWHNGTNPHSSCPDFVSLENPKKAIKPEPRNWRVDELEVRVQELEEQVKELIRWRQS